MVERVYPVVGPLPNEEEVTGAVVVVDPTAEPLDVDHDLARAERLDALGESLCRTRSEAIAARQQSGIEQTWREDDEYYDGFDGQNKGKSNWDTKPPGQAEIKGHVPTRSSVFPNITRPYCDAAAARIADMLLPTDDRAWSIQPTPVPDLIELSEGKATPEMLTGALQQAGGDPNVAKQVLGKAVEDAVRIMGEAKAKADKAQERISDWHIESQWHGEVRKVIESAARIGSGVLKGPVPAKKRSTVFVNGAIQIKEEIRPASRSIDPWNFYPDGACGESIHNGSYTWERDYLTSKKLRELKGNTDYIDSQIDLCLREGPQKATAEYTPNDELVEGKKTERYEIWYFHGEAQAEDMLAAGCECEEGTSVPAMLTIVNNRVIRASLNPLDSGEFPYDVMPWQRKPGMPWGQGVARQIRTPQRIVVAATRNLMDNAGIAAGPMLVFRQGVVTPADGTNEIRPRKIWFIAEDADGMADARQAIGVVKVDMMVVELMQIIQFGMKLAEDVTGLPMLLQGQQGSAPDTVGGMNILNNNASSVLRRLARLFDDYVTEPHVRRYYVWLLQYGDDSEKGEYVIDARGSTALVERDLQNQELAQLLQASLNPMFGVDPKKTMGEYLKSRRFSPQNFLFDDQKWEQIVANMSKGPADPRVEVEQLRAQLKQQTLQAEHAHETQEKAKDREVDMARAYLEAEANNLDLSSSERETLAKAKTILADTAIKVSAQRELSQRVVPMKPPSEPVGRAPAGQAYQR